MPLLGVPVSIKDSIAVKGLLFTGGLYARKDIIANEDADVVKNIRKSGAIPIVITNVPELLMWSDTKSVLVGQTNNPYDFSKTPGGSSGGEAALIASAGSVIGIGSDIGGSLRIPSFRCGIFAHKVTPNVISRKGLFPEMNDALSPLFTTGPMCRYAVDLIPTLKAIAGENIKLLPLIDTNVDLKSMKIYYMFGDKNILRPPLDKSLKDCLTKVVNYFEEKYDIDCVNVVFEEFFQLDEIWVRMVSSGYDFEHDFHTGKNGKTFLLFELFKSLFFLSFHTVRGTLFGLMNNRDPKFDSSKRKFLRNLRRKFNDVLGPNGVLLYPSGAEIDLFSTQTLLELYSLGYTSVFNVLGVPVTQCPLGLHSSGLPLGLQIATTPFNDHISIAIATELEKHFQGWVPPCHLNIKHQF